MVTVDSQSDPNERPHGDVSWLKRGYLLATMLGCALLMADNFADVDLWGHVQYGRDTLADGLSHTNTYSYTAEGHPWINHENLSELVLAMTADRGGGTALLLLKCLIGLAVIGVILNWGLRKGVAVGPLCLVSLLAALNIEYTWTVRPHLFTYLLFTLMLALLSWCFEGWEGHWHVPLLRTFARCEDQPSSVYPSRRLYWLWLTPAIFAVWTNAHGGVVAGFCVLAAYLICRGIEVLAVRGRQGLALAGHLALIVVACGLATTLNPYGLDLHRWFLESLGQPRPEITEWTPLTISRYPFYPFVLIAGVTLVGLILSRRCLDLTQLIILALTAWQVVHHERHISFFAILFGFWMPLHVESSLSRLWRSRAVAARSEPASAESARVYAVVAGMTCVVLLGLLSMRMRGIQVLRQRFPVNAFQYMADRNLTGKLVVHYDWAQYAIAAFGPQAPGRGGVLVAFDGRFRTCYPQEIVDMNIDFELGTRRQRHRSSNSPERVDGGRVLKFKQPDLVLLTRTQGHAVSVMERHRGEWVVLYQDRLAQLWGRASKYGDPESPDYIAAVDRKIGNLFHMGAVSWPAYPQPARTPDPHATGLGHDIAQGPQPGDG